MKKQQEEQESELRQYLLGELTLERQVLIEQRLFLDDDYSYLAQAVEDDLIDEYAYRDLTADERARFEAHFLKWPEHRDDLRIARALKKYTLSPPIALGHESFFRSLFRWKTIVGPLLAVLLIIPSVIGWLIFRSVIRQDKPPVLQGQDQPPQQTTPPVQATPDNARPEQAGTQSGDNRRQVETNERRTNERSQPQPRRPVQPPSIELAFTIAPGGFARGEGQGKNIAIPANAENVILRLPLITRSDYDTYSATLKNRGITLRKFPNLKSEPDDEWGKVVPVKVPAKLLRPDTYDIELSGVTQDQRLVDSNIYSFQVNKDSAHGDKQD